MTRPFGVEAVLVAGDGEVDQGDEEGAYEEEQEEAEEGEAEKQVLTRELGVHVGYRRYTTNGSTAMATKSRARYASE